MSPRPLRRTENAPHAAFARAVRSRRLELGITQQELAELLDLRQQSVGRWEAGNAAPQRRNWPKLEEFLGIGRAQLVALISPGAEIISFPRAAPPPAQLPADPESAAADDEQEDPKEPSDHKVPDGEPDEVKRWREHIRRRMVDATVARYERGLVDVDAAIVIAAAEYVGLPLRFNKEREDETSRTVTEVLRETFGIADAVAEPEERASLCPDCFNITEGGLCPFCCDERRGGSALCVVEEPLDIEAIERTGEFKGRYHVLQGRLSPLEGIGPERLRIKELLARIQHDGFDEVIVATSADIEGEATATYLARLLRPLGVRVDRIANGSTIGSAG